MKNWSILILFAIFGCSTQKQAVNLNSLSSSQIKSEGPGSGAPGKCYQKMKNEFGIVDWYEIICPSRKNEYKVASECLRKLGYKLFDNSTFRTANGNALIEFQQKEKLAYGALDEATLKLLLQKSTDHE